MKLQAAEESEKIDFLYLLMTENFDTKPNMAKFLKRYCLNIRISTKQKIQLWPKIHYDIGKCIIDFKNKWTLIKDYYKDNKNCDFIYYLEHNYDLIELTQKYLDKIIKFFNKLEEFHFIRNGNEDVKVFSTDIEKTNAQLNYEINCA